MGYEYQLLLLLQILFLTPVGKGAHFLLQASTGISRSSPAAIIWHDLCFFFCLCTLTNFFPVAPCFFRGKATLVAFFAPIFVIMLNKFALIEVTGLLFLPHTCSCKCFNVDAGSENV